MAPLGLGLGLGHHSRSPSAAAPPTGVPAMVAAPSISGFITDGQTAHATTGAWTNSPNAFAYQWQTSPDNATWTNAGANSASLSLAGLAGKYLRVLVTASNTQFGAGSAAPSASVGPISAALSISGAPATSVGVNSAYDFLPSAAGGHTPYNFAVTNKPAWASFNTSTGELSGTAPAAAETDSNIAIGVTDANGLTQTLTPWTLTVSAITYKNAHYDDFSGAAAGSNLGGRALTTGGLSWAFDNGGTSNSTSVQVDGSGRLKFDGGTGPRDTAATITPASVKPNRIIRQRLSVGAGDVAAPSAVTQILFSLNKIGTSNYSGLHLTWAPASGTGTTAINAATAGAIHGGTVTSNAGIGGSAVGRNGGDVLAHLKYPGASGQIYMDTVLNGRRVTDGSSKDLSASIPTWNDVLGIQGGDGTVGGGTPGYASILDDITYADPATEFVLEAYRPGKTCSRTAWKGFPSWTGGGSQNDVRVPIVLDYSISDPASTDITVTLYAVDGAGGETAMTGYVDLPLSNFQIVTPVGSNLWGRLKGEVTIAAADAPDTLAFTYRGKRNLSAYGLSPAYCFSPILRPGLIVLGTGQSLETKDWQANSVVWTIATQGGMASPYAGGYTDPPHSWAIDGSDDGVSSPTTPLARRVVPSSCLQASYVLSNTAHGFMMATLATLFGHSNFSYIRGGHGGTTTPQRNPTATYTKAPDSLNYTASFQATFSWTLTTPATWGANNTWGSELDGIDLAGDLTIETCSGGVFDADHTTGTWPNTPTGNAQAAASVKQATIDRITAREAYLGHPILVVLQAPPWTYQSGTDDRFQAICRAKWELCDGAAHTPMGSVFIWGPDWLDLQHTASGDSTGNGGTANDQYHLTFGWYGWAEGMRRRAYAIAKYFGKSTSDRNGPDLYALTAWTDHSVTLRIAKMGAATIALSPGCSSAYADNRCGLTFSAGDTTFGTAVTPSAMPTIVDVDASYADVTFPFAAATFGTGGAAPKPCVRGPHGSAPYNRATDSNINLSTVDRMSMLVGTFAGEPLPIPLRRHFSASGTDYFVGA